MITSDILKNNTPKPISEKEALSRLAEEIAEQLIVNIKMKSLEAARSGKKELIVGKCFRSKGLLKEALSYAANKLIKMGLVTSFDKYKSNGKTVTVLKIVW